MDLNEEFELYKNEVHTLMDKIEDIERRLLTMAIALEKHTHDVRGYAVVKLGDVPTLVHINNETRD